MQGLYRPGTVLDTAEHSGEDNHPPAGGPGKGLPLSPGFINCT